MLFMLTFTVFAASRLEPTPPKHLRIKQTLGQLRAEATPIKSRLDGTLKTLVSQDDSQQEQHNREVLVTRVAALEKAQEALLSRFDALEKSSRKGRQGGTASSSLKSSYDHYLLSALVGMHSGFTSWTHGSGWPKFRPIANAPANPNVWPATIHGIQELAELTRGTRVFMVDCGYNRGQTTKFFFRNVPSASVLAFEPNRQLVEDSIGKGVPPHFTLVEAAKPYRGKAWGPPSLLSVNRISYAKVDYC